MTNLKSVTYYSLHHTHLLVAHVSVTDNEIIHKHQTEKNFSSSPPQFPHTDIHCITDFSYSSCFINFYYFHDSSCNSKCIEYETKRITKHEIKYIQR